jgi:predicted nucleotidyltransferase
MGRPSPEQLARLSDACVRAGSLELAILFGSQVAGRAGAHSDFDIGIIPTSSSMSLHDELALASALSEATGTEVDLVRLDAEDLLVGREVAQNGVCLFERAPGSFAAFRAAAMSRWIELEETLAPYRARYLRRLAGSRP